MKNLLGPRMAMALVFTFAIVAHYLPELRSQSAGDDIDLPKVEKDFSVIDTQFTHDGSAFAALIPPESIRRIILLHDNSGADGNADFDPDRLMQQLFKSPVVSKSWGLDALEKTKAELLVVTKKGDVFKLTVLTQLVRTKGTVSGVLLYGKGVSWRFDFRSSPLNTRKRD